ncbi:hypothetical protein Tco_0539463, partial [Tanacetum coccineum]
LDLEVSSKAYEERLNEADAMTLPDQS